MRKQGRRKSTIAILLLALTGLGVAAMPAGSAPNTAGAHASGESQLGFFYRVKLHNITESSNATGVLTGIKQNAHGGVVGKLIVAPPLFGGGPFSGTVSKNSVKFVVESTTPNPCNCVSLTFVGTVDAKGVMNGTYIGKTKTWQEHGTWQASPHTTFNCKIRSHANHQYVTAEVTHSGAGLAGLLRARSPDVGSWQQFQCVAVGANQWALRSRASGKFVTTEVDYPGALKGLLRARSPKVGSWQRYTFQAVPSCACFALKAVNGKFVTAELANTGDNYGILRARSAKVGKWTTFDVTST
jgi:hypothetical protein